MHLYYIATAPFDRHFFAKYDFRIKINEIDLEF
jgi:hypothetical protein